MKRREFFHRVAQALGVVALAPLLPAVPPDPSRRFDWTPVSRDPRRATGALTIPPKALYARIRISPEMIEASRHERGAFVAAYRAEYAAAKRETDRLFSTL